MKTKILLSLFFISLFALYHSKQAGATYTILRDASTINKGTLNSARLDHSSVAFKGESVATMTVVTDRLDNFDVFKTTAQTLIDSNQSGVSVSALFRSTAEPVLDAGVLFRSSMTAGTADLTVNTISGDGAGLTNVGGFVNLNATQTFTGKNTFERDVIIGTSTLAWMFSPTNMVNKSQILFTQNDAGASVSSATIEFVGRNSANQIKSKVVFEEDAVDGFGSIQLYAWDNGYDIYHRMAKFSYVNGSRIQAQSGITVLDFLIEDTQGNIDASDSWITFGSNSGEEGSISGTGAQGVIAYNTFTGSHYTQISSRDNLEVGILLEATGEKITDWGDVTVKVSSNVEVWVDNQANEVDKGDVKAKVKITKTKIKDKVRKSKASIKNQISKSIICETSQSKAVWGVWGGLDKEGRDMVFSIGTGFILVYDDGTNIEVGDYLTSTGLKKGYAVKQSDDILHNYTVGKALEAVDWGMESGTTKLITCTYHGG